MGAAATGLTDFLIPVALEWQYGDLPLTHEDKRKTFSGNPGRLPGIDTA